MFSIRVICLVSFHYLRRRRLRRFYANRGERRSSAFSLHPSPIFSLFGVPAFSNTFLIVPAPSLHLYYHRSLSFFSFTSFSAVSWRQPWPTLLSSLLLSLLLLLRSIRIIIFPSRFGARRINIIHNSFHFFGVH